MVPELFVPCIFVPSLPASVGTPQLNWTRSLDPWVAGSIPPLDLFRWRIFPSRNLDSNRGFSSHVP